MLSELGLWDAEDGGEFLDVFGGGLCLAVEQSCDGDLGAPEFGGDVLEGEGFRSLGVEEGFGGGGEAVDEGGLERERED